MKVTLKLFLAAVGLSSVQAGGNSKLQEHEVCYVSYNTNNGHYQTEGAMCDNGLDCNYHVADDGATDEPIAGMCEPTGCYGSNGNQPPGEGTSRVTICHRTCSENNPWVRITIDEDGWDGAGCGHMNEHDILEDCNMDNKDRSAWGVNHKDYLIKRHGTRDDVRAMLAANNEGLSDSEISTLEKDYWKYWEPACPYVRNGKCCDWDSGHCCGDDTLYDTPKTAGIHGDPHIKRWDRKKFMWNGECDLVLVKSDHVGLENKKLDLHVRTKITDTWSSVESAVLKVGTFKFQIDNTPAIFFQDGSKVDSDLPITENDITLLAPVTDATTGMKNYTVTITDSSFITFSLVGSFVNVDIRGHTNDFKNSVGLVGSFEAGKPIDRTGARIYDLDAHAAFWQVNDVAHGDPILFKTASGPQAPGETCNMPTTTTRRGLRTANKELYTAAVEACSGKADYDLCIDDVVYTGEIGLASLHE